MIAAVEGIELDRVDGAGMPEPQRIHMRATPADYRRVIADRHNLLGRRPAIARRLALAFGRNRAAEAHFIGRLAAGKFPRIAIDEPVLRQLDLPAVDDLL